jgi:hypothetical protein
MSESLGPDHIIGGRYRLLERIGRGGMGTVWRAHDEVLGRDIAIKEIAPPPGMTTPEREIFTIRTFREARAAGRVSHPGVAAVYDVIDEQGHPWIAMQFVPSQTLGAALRERGPLSPVQAARIGIQLLAALRAAHQAGVLHRDVKPDNVLITEDGRAVLTDFGIATLDDDASVTRTGTLIGTPAFIAPERAAGGDAVRASDMWSLGVTLYLAVEGRSPFQRGHPLATLAAVIHDEPAPLSRAGALGPVIMGLLEKDPDRRFTSEQAARPLHALVSGPSPQVTVPITAPTAWAALRPEPPVPATGMVDDHLAAAQEPGGLAPSHAPDPEAHPVALPPEAAYTEAAYAQATRAEADRTEADHAEAHGVETRIAGTYRPQAHHAPTHRAGAGHAGAGHAGAGHAGAGGRGPRGAADPPAVNPEPPLSGRAKDAAGRDGASGRARLALLAGLTALTLAVGLVSGAMAWLSARSPVEGGPAVPTFVSSPGSSTASRSSPDGPSHSPGQNVRQAPPVTDSPSPYQSGEEPSALPRDDREDRNDKGDRNDREDRDNGDNKRDNTEKPKDPDKKPPKETESPPPTDEEETPPDVEVPPPDEETRDAPDEATSEPSSVGEA